MSAWLLLLGAQLMDGLTFSLVHLASMQVLARATPQRFFATVQGLYGISGNAISSAAGAMFSKLQAQAFIFPAVLCCIALPFTLRLSAQQAASSGAK